MQRPDYRVYLTPGPRLAGFGLVGCLGGVFLVGGVIGLLILGWKTLLGL